MLEQRVMQLPSHPHQRVADDSAFNALHCMAGQRPCEECGVAGATPHMHVGTCRTPDAREWKQPLHSLPSNCLLLPEGLSGSVCLMVDLTASNALCLPALTLPTLQT